MLTRLDLTVIVILLAGGLFFLEASHRVELVAPAVAGPMPTADPACAGAARYMANRLVFLSSGEAAALTPRQAIADRVAPPPGCQR